MWNIVVVRSAWQSEKKRLRVLAQGIIRADCIVSAQKGGINIRKMLGRFWPLHVYYYSAFCWEENLDHLMGDR